MDRRYRYKTIREMAERLVPFLAVCREADLFCGDRAEVVRAKAVALGAMLPDVRRAILEWLASLDDLRRDLPYRERALRAEKALKDLRKRRGEAGR